MTAPLTGGERPGGAADPLLDFRAIADSVDQMIWSTRADGFHDYYNRRWYEFTGVPVGSTDGEGWNDMFHPEDQERAWTVWLESLETGAPYEIEYRLRHRSGVYRWVLGRAQPTRDVEGRITRWYGTCTDIHDLKVTQDAVRDREARLSAALRVARLGMFDWAPGAGAIKLDLRAREILDLDEAVEPSAREILGRIAPTDRERVRRAFERARSEDVPLETHFNLILPSGQGRSVVTMTEAALGPERVFGVIADVTERQRIEEHLRLMLNELNHRVKNTLATVQSIIALTVRGHTAPQDLRQVLTARLIALSRAHNVLTDEQWAHADLAELAAQTAEPYRAGARDTRFRVRGPRVKLSPSTAISMALALHELATNAAKYGGLSTPDGQVLLTWTVEVKDGGRSLTLIWREMNGPPVTPPTRTGFGTRLIERTMSGETQADAKLDYQPDGLVCTIECRLDPPVTAASRFAIDGEDSNWRVTDDAGGAQRFDDKGAAMRFVAHELQELRGRGRSASVVFRRGANEPSDP